MKVKQTLAEVLELRRTILKDLFGPPETSWIEIVKQEYYPTLIDVKNVFEKVCPKANVLSSGCGGFSFPKSLDDFGFRSWVQNEFPNRFLEMKLQWCSNDEEIISEQKTVHETYHREFPIEKANWIYLMGSKLSGELRVVYVGVAESYGGLLNRFFQGSGLPPKGNKYLGDCRSAVSNGNQYRSIRLKSAELRRRAVSYVWWAKLEFDPKPIEKALIKFKIKHIRERSNTFFKLDPINK